MTERYRPHHIFCERFLSLHFPERGDEFAEAGRRLIEIIGSHEETLVEAIEGVDQVCRLCENCRDDRCQSPAGNEDAVRKWDAIILKGLGIAYGETRTAKQWRALIDGMAPLHFCTSRCPHGSECTITRPR